MSVSKESSENDLSTPEEEKTSSFHTPKHVSTTLSASLSGNVIASQDSLDVFHDAFSSLHASYKTVFSQSPCHQTQKKKCRRRHFSSGTKFDEKNDECDSDEEAEEDTRMLTSGNVPRIRPPVPKSHYQLSRSCNGSPYHFPRFSFSTNSLKRNAEGIGGGGQSITSPKRTPSTIQGGSVTIYKPGEEVNVINESDENLCIKEKFLQANTIPVAVAVIVAKNDNSNSLSDLKQNKGTEHNLSTSKNDNEQNKVNTCLNWKQGYVPCVDINSHYELPFCEKQNIETQITGLPESHFSNIQRKRKCCETFKEEFQKKNFKLTHRAPHLFVTSQWQQPNEMCCMYLAYRLFWGVYFLMWAIWSWVGFAGYSSPIHLKSFYPIFFTNWGIWILAFDTMFQAVNVALHVKKISEEGMAKYSIMKTSFKCSWVLSNITSTIHIFITLVFWCTVYPLRSNPITEISVNTHIIPCIYVILDSFVSATPRRILHAYFPMMLVLIYGLFTDIYYLFGGKDHKENISIYPILNWNEQFKTLLIGSGIVLFLVPFIHLFIYTLFVLRIKLWRSLNYSRHFLENEYDKPVTMEEKV